MSLNQAGSQMETTSYSRQLTPSLYESNLDFVDGIYLFISMYATGKYDFTYNFLHALLAHCLRQIIFLKTDQVTLETEMCWRGHVSMYMK